jgi:O-antigen ligase
MVETRDVTHRSGPARRSSTSFLTVLIGVSVVAGLFSIAVSQGLMILTGLIWLGNSIARRRAGGELRLPLTWPIFGFLGVSLLSALFAADPVAGLVELRTSWVPFVFFLACVNTLSLSTSLRLVRYLAVAGILSCLVVSYQVISQGLDHRVHGTMSHYMTFAGLTLAVLLLMLAQLLFRRSARRDAWLLTAAAGLFVALLLTQTRSAWLGLTVGVGLLIWLLDKRALVAVPAVALVVFLLGPAPVKERLRSFGNLRDVSAVERLYMWRSGVAMALDNPLTGVGPGNVRRAYPSYKHVDDPWLEHRRFTHLHSNVIQMAAERGLLGLATWTALWVAFLFAGARRYYELGGDVRIQLRGFRGDQSDGVRDGTGLRYGASAFSPGKTASLPLRTAIFGSRLGVARKRVIARDDGRPRP